MTVKRNSKKVVNEKIYCFGLNNHHQLGFESVDANEGIEKLPV